MIRSFFKSKLLILFLLIIFVGFLIGYDYALLTSKAPVGTTFGTPASLPGATLPG